MLNPSNRPSIAPFRPPNFAPSTAPRIDVSATMASRLYFSGLLVLSSSVHPIRPIAAPRSRPMTAPCRPPNIPPRTAPRIPESAMIHASLLCRIFPLSQSNLRSLILICKSAARFFSQFGRFFRKDVSSKSKLASVELPPPPPEDVS